MACEYPRNELVMEVAQGESRGFSFTIQQKVYDEEQGQDVLQPFDLTDWTVKFYVKIAPYYSTKPLIEKEITTTSDELTTGYINDPTNGKFSVQIAQEETLFPPYDYYLIIELVNDTQVISISQFGNVRSIFRVLTQ